MRWGKGRRLGEAAPRAEARSLGGTRLSEIAGVSVSAGISCDKGPAIALQVPCRIPTFDLTNHTCQGRGLYIRNIEVPEYCSPQRQETVKSKTHRFYSVQSPAFGCYFCASALRLSYRQSVASHFNVTTLSSSHKSCKSFDVTEIKIENLQKLLGIITLNGTRIHSVGCKFSIHRPSHGVALQGAVSQTTYSYAT